MADAREVIMRWLGSALVNSSRQKAADDLLADLSEAGFVVEDRVQMEQTAALLRESNEIARQNLAGLKDIRAKLAFLTEEGA